MTGASGDMHGVTAGSMTECYRRGNSLFHVVQTDRRHGEEAGEWYVHLTAHDEAWL